MSRLGEMSDAEFQVMLDSVAAMGRACHFSQRKIARDVGLTELPGCVIYVNGEPIVRPACDVTKLEPGEAEYLAGLTQAVKPREGR